MRQTPRLALKAWKRALKGDLKQGNLRKLLPLLGEDSEAFNDWDTPFQGLLALIAAGQEQELFREIAAMKVDAARRRIILRLVNAATKYPQGSALCDRADGATVRQVLREWDLVPAHLAAMLDASEVERLLH